MKRPVWIARTAAVFLCLLCIIALLITCCLWRSTTCPSLGAAKSASVEGAAIAPSLTKGTCGETGTLSLLFIGADYSGGNPPPGADAIRLIRVDYDVKTVLIVSLPRDLWLPASGLNDPNMPEQTLRLAYYYKKQASTGSDKSRCGAGGPHAPGQFWPPHRPLSHLATRYGRRRGSEPAGRGAHRVWPHLSGKAERAGLATRQPILYAPSRAAAKPDACNARISSLAPWSNSLSAAGGLAKRPTCWGNSMRP
ncbi:MAG: hypothetical protein GYA59_02675 [Chloroflexi bacterium]|nr:hypothetical protein [Chloroflexota bacterium]